MADRKFKVTMHDGRTFMVTADHAPSEQELLDYIGEQSQEPTGPQTRDTRPGGGVGAPHANLPDDPSRIPATTAQFRDPNAPPPLDFGSQMLSNIGGRMRRNLNLTNEQRMQNVTQNAPGVLGGLRSLLVDTPASIASAIGTNDPDVAAQGVTDAAGYLPMAEGAAEGLSAMGRGIRGAAPGVINRAGPLASKAATLAKNNPRATGAAIGAAGGLATGGLGGMVTGGLSGAGVGSAPSAFRFMARSALDVLAEQARQAQQQAGGPAAPPAGPPPGAPPAGPGAAPAAPGAPSGPAAPPGGPSGPGGAAPPNYSTNPGTRPSQPPPAPPQPGVQPQASPAVGYSGSMHPPNQALNKLLAPIDYSKTDALPATKPKKGIIQIEPGTYESDPYMSQRLRAVARNKVEGVGPKTAEGTFLSPKGKDIEMELLARALDQIKNARDWYRK